MCLTYFVSAGGGIWRDRLVELEADRFVARGIDGHLARRAEEVARRAVPLLALAPVHRQLHHVAVRAVERLVLVEQSLHAVAARLDVAEASAG